MHTITLLFHAYLYLRCLERGGLEWSCSVAEDNSLDCFIRIYYRHETCRDYRATIPLSVQQILHLNVFPIMFYESLNVQNRMCELCMFSQIRSHV